MWTKHTQLAIGMDAIFGGVKEFWLGYKERVIETMKG